MAGLGTLELTLDASQIKVAIDEALAESSAKRVSVVDLIARQPWAITPDAMETILSIARRENEGPESVAAKLGRPLQNTRTVSIRDGVAVVPVTGPIFRYANLFTEISGATSLDVLATDFSAALSNPSVKGIVLGIDSPGGQASGIAEFASMVRRADKPVVAYVDGMAASAAYWIASAASDVVLSKTGEVGSIGAVIGVDVRKRDGMMEIVSSQSPNKRPDAATDEGRREIQTRIDALAQVFIEDVASYRSVSAETVMADFGQGGIRMGTEAVRLGMADRISSLEDVIAGLAGSTTTGVQRMANENGSPAAEKPVIDRAYLDANHPDLVSAIFEEGHTAGATFERERIKAIESVAMPGHEKMIAEMKFDGKTMWSGAAARIIEAEKATRGNRLADIKADAPNVVKAASTDDNETLAGLSVEDRCKAQWEKDEKVRSEFDSLASYTAYSKAEAGGRIKILGRKTA